MLDTPLTVGCLVTHRDRPGVNYLVTEIKQLLVYGVPVGSQYVEFLGDTRNVRVVRGPAVHVESVSYAD